MHDTKTLQPGWRSHWHSGGLFHAGLLAIILGCGEQHDGADALVETAPITPSRIVLRGPMSPPDQPLDLFRTFDIALIGDSIALVDNGNDRIVLIDSALNVLWVRGREGAGPGEFEAPFGVAESPEGLVVVDMGNGRFTEMDRRGNLLRTTSAPAASRSFGVRSDGAIVVPNRGPTHYAWIVRSGEQTPFAERLDSADSRGGTEVYSAPPLVQVTSGDTTHVLDDAKGELRKYDPDGRLIHRAALPFAVVDSIRTRAARVNEAFARQGLRVLSTSTAKDLSLTGDGRLLVVIHAANTVAILVDPHTYRARRIVIPADEAEWAPLKNASSMVLLGHRLFALQGDSVFVYEIDEAS